MLPNNANKATTSQFFAGINFEKCLENIDKIDWDEYINNIDWGIEDDTAEEEEVVVINTPSSSTSKIKNNNIKKKTTPPILIKEDKIIEDGMQPCSSKTPISTSNRISSFNKKILNKNLTAEAPSTSATNSRVLKVGLEHRRHLPPQVRHKNPYVPYKRFRDALSDSACKTFRAPGIDQEVYNKILQKVEHLVPSEEECRNEDSIITKTYRAALSAEIKKALKTGELLQDDQLQYEMINYEKHLSGIILGQVSDEQKFQSEKIDERDKISRRMIAERYEEEKEKLERQYEAAVTELAEKMIKENEDERKQLEAELAAIGEDGEVPANFSYLPNRKQLRRRTGNLNESGNEHPDKIDPKSTYVPIHEVHWINPRQINEDLSIINSVLEDTDEGPFEKHTSFQIQEGKLILDGRTFNRGLHQILMIKSQSYGEFPAIMLSLCENCLTVRSIIKGDPRHLTITRSDLENGRVRISKRTT